MEKQGRSVKKGWATEIGLYGNVIEIYKEILLSRMCSDVPDADQK